MLVTSIIMLILGFFGLVAGIILICMKKTRKAGIITTVSSVCVGIIFTIVLVVGAVNEGVKAIDEASSDSNYSDESETATDDSTSEEAPAVDETTAPSSVAVGEAIDFQDEAGNPMVSVTLDSLEKFNGDDMYTPTGPFMVKATFTYNNIGSEVYTPTAGDYSIYDSVDKKGEVNAKDYMVEEIAPGKSFTGVVYFDIENAGPFEIHLYDSSWAGDVK